MMGQWFDSKFGSADFGKIDTGGFTSLRVSPGEQSAIDTINAIYDWVKTQSPKNDRAAQLIRAFNTWYANLEQKFANENWLLFERIGEKEVTEARNQKIDIQNAQSIVPEFVKEKPPEERTGILPNTGEEKGKLPWKWILVGGGALGVVVLVGQLPSMLASGLAAGIFSRKKAA